jgi:hypothetical protein
MSANSKDAIRESYVLIIKLLERTREDKIEWTEAEPHGSASKAIIGVTKNAYQAKLGRNLIATVWENNQSLGFNLVELNFQSGPPLPPDLNQPSKDYEREVLSVCLSKQEKVSGNLTDESIVYEDLAALIELIERVPVKADARIEQARRYLDQLAS